MTPRAEAEIELKKMISLAQRGVLTLIGGKEVFIPVVFAALESHVSKLLDKVSK